MTTVSIHEAKARLSRLISSLERDGSRILIQRHGRPVAQLLPVAEGSRTKPHPKLKRIILKEDPTEPTVKEWEDV